MDGRLFFSVVATCATGAFAGVMLVIALVLGTYWKSLPPEDFLDWFATNSPLIARLIPFLVIPILIGAIGALVYDWTLPRRRLLWLLALGCIFGILTITFAFHLPANSLFSAKTVPAAEVAPLLDRWLWLHGVRVALGFAASVLSALALSQASVS